LCETPRVNVSSIPSLNHIGQSFFARWVEQSWDTTQIRMYRARHDPTRLVNSVLRGWMGDIVRCFGRFAYANGLGRTFLRGDHELCELRWTKYLCSLVDILKLIRDPPSQENSYLGRLDGHGLSLVGRWNLVNSSWSKVATRNYQFSCKDCNIQSYSNNFKYIFIIIYSISYTWGDLHCNGWLSEGNRNMGQHRAYTMQVAIAMADWRL
jgi:hypothetical protein